MAVPALSATHSMFQREKIKDRKAEEEIKKKRNRKSPKCYKITKGTEDTGQVFFSDAIKTLEKRRKKIESHVMLKMEKGGKMHKQTKKNKRKKDKEKENWTWNSCCSMKCKSGEGKKGRERERERKRHGEREKGQDE